MPNAQNLQGKNLKFPLAFLTWEFWELRLGRYLGVGNCGVVELAEPVERELTMSKPLTIVGALVLSVGNARGRLAAVAGA